MEKDNFVDLQKDDYFVTNEGDGCQRYYPPVSWKNLFRMIAIIGITIAVALATKSFVMPVYDATIGTWVKALLV